MTLANVLASETGFTLITAILGSIWTAFKSSEWRRRARNERYNRALEALESAVEFIDDDELVEITPKSIRIRKRFLLEHERKKASRAA